MGALLSSRGQAWSVDAMVSVFIFVGGIVFIFMYTLNYEPQTELTVQDLFSQGVTLSELVLDNEDPGVLTNNKINESKLDDLYDLNYTSMKRLYAVRDEFYFTFDGLEIEGVPVSYIGNKNDSEVRNLVVVSRLGIYRNAPVNINFYIWD